MGIKNNISIGWLESINKAKKYRNVIRAENIYIGKYSSLPTDQRDRQAALDASDNGRCWWIKEFVRRKPYWKHDNKQSI